MDAAGARRRLVAEGKRTATRPARSRRGTACTRTTSTGPRLLGRRIVAGRDAPDDPHRPDLPRRRPVPDRHHPVDDEAASPRSSSLSWSPRLWRSSSAGSRSLRSSEGRRTPRCRRRDALRDDPGGHAHAKRRRRPRGRRSTATSGSSNASAARRSDGTRATRSPTRSTRPAPRRRSGPTSAWPSPRVTRATGIHSVRRAPRGESFSGRTSGCAIERRDRQGGADHRSVSTTTATGRSWSDAAIAPLDRVREDDGRLSPRTRTSTSAGSS